MNRLYLSVVLAILCSTLAFGQTTVCTGYPKTFNGKPCASTTRYWDGQMGACGCGTGDQSPFSWQWTKGTAAASAPIFGSGTWCGTGCGKCFKLTPTAVGASPIGTGAPNLNSLVVKVTNLCPYGGNEQWCAYDVNSYGYDAHFDLMDYNMAGLISTTMGWNNPEVTYEEVDCASNGYEDWNCQCKNYAGNVTASTSTSAPATAAPTSAPATAAPATPAPSKAATSAPTSAPTDAPTHAPTDAPTDAPTHAPTDAPTDAPTHAPTDAPTDAPTHAPSTAAPTSAPTTTAPTQKPTKKPTHPHTEPATDAPTQAATQAPTEGTSAPTEEATPAPTEAGTTPVKIQLNGGSNAWWIGFSVVSPAVTSIAKVEIKDNSQAIPTWTSMTYEGNPYWNMYSINPSTEMKAPLSLRITATCGTVVTANNIITTFQAATIDTGVAL